MARLVASLIAADLRGVACERFGLSLLPERDPNRTTPADRTAAGVALPDGWIGVRSVREPRCRAKGSVRGIDRKQCRDVVFAIARQFFCSFVTKAGGAAAAPGSRRLAIGGDFLTVLHHLDRAAELVLRTATF